MFIWTWYSGLSQAQALHCYTTSCIFFFLRFALTVANSRVFMVLEFVFQNKKHPWKAYLCWRRPKERMERTTDEKENEMKRSVSGFFDFVDEMWRTNFILHIFGTFCILKHASQSELLQDCGDVGRQKPNVCVTGRSFYLQRSLYRFV